MIWMEILNCYTGGPLFTNANVSSCYHPVYMVAVSTCIPGSVVEWGFRNSFFILTSVHGRVYSLVNHRFYMRNFNFLTLEYYCVSELTPDGSNFYL